MRHLALAHSFFLHVMSSSWQAWTPAVLQQLASTCKVKLGATTALLENAAPTAWLLAMRCAFPVHLRCYPQRSPLVVQDRPQAQTIKPLRPLPLTPSTCMAVPCLRLSVATSLETRAWYMGHRSRVKQIVADVLGFSDLPMSQKGSSTALACWFVDIYEATTK